MIIITLQFLGRSLWKRGRAYADSEGPSLSAYKIIGYFRT